MNKELLRSQRQSNFELLRIISMLLVLVVHADFLSLGYPSKELFESSPLSVFLRCFSESISIICVNVFVLISGWFGIHVRINRIFELVFQVLFFCAFVPILLFFLNCPLPMNLGEYLRTFVFCDEMWFVRAYLILLLFSPVLNAFVDNSDRYLIKIFLIVFFVVQTFFGNRLTWFSGGYSPLSFMGIYILARYLHRYPSKYTTLIKVKDLLIYFICVLLLTFSALFIFYKQISGIGTLYAYSSPLVVISSVYFFLFFSKISFHSPIVNWIAISSFSIYLLHCNPLFLEPLYLKSIRQWYSLDTWLFLCYVVGFMLLVFVISIFLDKFRVIIWNQILTIIQKYVTVV